MTIVIDAPKAIELLEEAVEERGPDFVYLDEAGGRSKCAYWHKSTNTPGCIVGWALHRAGVTPDSIIGIETYKGSREGEHKPTGAQELAGLIVDDVEITREASEIFCAVQERQDTGAPWGTAVKYVTDPDCVDFDLNTDDDY